MGTDLLAFDLETALIQPGLLAPPIVCGSFASPKYGSSLLSHDDTIVEMTEQLTDESIVWVGANIAYDFGCLLAECPQLLPAVWKAYEEGRVFDVLIASTLNAIYDGRMRDGELFRKDGSKIQSGRYSLDECVREWLGRADAKKNDKWRRSYWLLRDTPLTEWPEEARQYPLDDARNTLEVAQAQLRGSENLNDLKAQAHAAFCLHLGSIWGLRTDPESVKVLKGEVDSHLAKIALYGHVCGFLRDDGTKDTKAIREAVFKAYQGNPPTTAKGETSTSRETLEDSGDKNLVRWAESSKWEKLRTYIPALEEAAAAPLNVSANPLLATGRASYSGLIQLMPRKGGVRECFVPRPGRVMSSVDYAAIEMSTLAQVQLWTLGTSKLADAINSGLDPHSLFAASMTGVKYEDFLAKRKQPREAGLRHAAKAANFGFPGLMGEAKFVEAKSREGESVCEWLHRDGACRAEMKRTHKGRRLDAPLCVRCIEEAAKLRQAYLNQWPEMQPYWRWVQAQTEGSERVEQFVSKRIRGGLSAPAAANTLFQGLAADGAKRAVVALTREMYLLRESSLYGSRLLVFAHDETLLEIPEPVAHEAAMEQSRIMVAKMRELVPDVKVTAEPALMRRWDKRAEAKYDAGGRLIPWEP